MYRRPVWDRFGIQAISGGGPPPYVASAVHFDGSTFLSNASLVANASDTVMSVVFWAKQLVTDPPGSSFMCDPANAASYCELAPFGGGIHELSMAVDAGNNVGTVELVNSGVISTDVWNCYITSINTTTGVGKLYVNDVDLTSPSTNNSPLTMTWNGKQVLIGSGQPFFNVFTGDLCDLRIMPGTSLLTAGDISVATRRLFIDGSGKPVDPATATASLGTPIMLFSGDASTFATNQGSGGAFTTTGTLTNASSHP